MEVQSQAGDDYFLPEEHQIGELRLELLETDALPSMDAMLDENDVYAIVIFEDSLAKTETIGNVTRLVLNHTPRIKHRLTLPLKCLATC